MIHARPDYNRIQDPENKIGEDEPVVLFRAQDKHFGSVLKFYYDTIKKDGGDPRILEQLEAQKIRLDKWTETNKQKSPDAV